MKKTILAMSIFAVLTTGLTVQCAQAQSVSTQSRQGSIVVNGYPSNNSPSPSPIQPQNSQLIPYTVIGEPNVIHYLDPNTVQQLPQQRYYTIPNTKPNNGNYNSNYSEGYNVPSNAPSVSTNPLSRILNTVISPNGNLNNSNVNVYSNNYGNTNYAQNTNQNAGISYVPPTTRAPSGGYEWRYNTRYGWGWYSAQYGWYQGWQ